MYLVRVRIRVQEYSPPGGNIIHWASHYGFIALGTEYCDIISPIHGQFAVMIFELIFGMVRLPTVLTEYSHWTGVSTKFIEDKSTSL